MLNNYICALDIGSSKIAGVVAQIKRKRIINIFLESIPSKGVKRGLIIDAVDLVDSLSRLLKNLKVKSGINIKSVYTNISGEDIVTKHSRAVIPLAERGNKVITLSDMQKVNEQARILGSDLEEEIIHRIPFGYTIDSGSNILNPLGLYSHRLEADLYLVCSRLSSLQSFSRVINQAGSEIKNLFFSGLATSKVVFNQGPLEGLNILCDIGSDITEVLIFKDGRLLDIEILALGGADLTTQLSETLKIPFDLAEEIKSSSGIIGDPEQIGEDRQILVKESRFYKPIKQKLVSQIITKSAKTICSQIKDAVKDRVSSYEVNNFVVVGRTVLLEGFIETLENILSIPVKLGRITNPDTPAFIKESEELSGQKYLTYLTALGMVSGALSDETAALKSANPPAKNLILKAVHRFKEVYQEYF